MYPSATTCGSYWKKRASVKWYKNLSILLKTLLYSLQIRELFLLVKLIKIGQLRRSYICPDTLFLYQTSFQKTERYCFSFACPRSQLFWNFINYFSITLDARLSNMFGSVLFFWVAINRDRNQLKMKKFSGEVS